MQYALLQKQFDDDEKPWKWQKPVLNFTKPGSVVSEAFVQPAHLDLDDMS